MRKLNDHKLERREGLNYCLICHQSWKGKPRSLCPGAKFLGKKTLELDYQLKQKYWQIDSLKHKNLRPLTKACCIRDGKNYIYFYDREGETEKIDPSLPTVVDFEWSMNEALVSGWNQSWLKTELALKELNLQPRNAEPVACFFSSLQLFKRLYNPLDCAVYIQNLPSFRPERKDLLSSDLLTRSALAKMNLQPSGKAIAATWNSRLEDWELYWDIKQGELADPSLPPVFTEVLPDCYFEEELFSVNRELTSDVDPCGCLWNDYKEAFVYFYRAKDCPILFPQLPPIVKKPHYASTKSFGDLCLLKNRRGLRRLNLKPGDAEPVAVYHQRGEFIFLFNPLDCIVYIENLPPVLNIYYSHFSKETDLLGSFFMKKLNLKPRSQMLPCFSVWDSWEEDWEMLWDIKQLEIDNPILPPCYLSNDYPTTLYLASQLSKLNRQATPEAKASGCFWCRGEWVRLYYPEDCDYLDPKLPPCYHRAKIPPNLKSERDWKRAEPLFELKPEVEPKGCYYDPYQLVWLYDRSCLQPHDREIFLSKTQLKKVYHLSPKFLEKLGQPDKIKDNPIDKNFAPMQLFSRGRIEQFLADNAEEYTKHLSRRETYLAIFERNREKLLSPKSRRKARQTRRLKKEAYKLKNQFIGNDSKEKILQQSLKCLRCASGLVMGQGFFCAIHPTGLEVDRLPCPDFNKKS